MKDREKELKYLIYLENEVIKQAKKDIKTYRSEIKQINAEKGGRNGKSKVKNKKRW